jgi:hypothetical protein
MHKLLIILLSLLPLASHAASAAADVKAAHAASQATPLLIPEHIQKLLYESPIDPHRVIAWLRAHPDYRNAYYMPDSPLITHCLALHHLLSPVFFTLVRMRAHPHNTLKTFLQSDLIVQHSFKDADWRHTIRITHLQSHFIQDLIDLTLEHHVMSLPDIHSFISQQIAYHQSVKRGDEPNNPEYNHRRRMKYPEQYIPVLEEALKYVTMLLTERRTQMKEVLDPVLPPDLITIAAEYDTAAPEQSANAAQAQK